jgi:hypothetical protein
MSSPKHITGRRATTAIPPSFTPVVFHAMSAILVEACSLLDRLQDEAGLRSDDRAALQCCAKEIGQRADAVLSWLREFPLETPRH